MSSLLACHPVMKPVGHTRLHVVSSGFIQGDAGPHHAGSLRRIEGLILILYKI